MANLSRIHLEILQWTALGKTADIIARIMDTTIRRVRKRQEEIRTNLGASNLAHAVAIALRDGVIR